MDAIKNAVKTWEATSVQGIYRHKSGRLYARIYSEGTEKWRSLKTPLMEIAKARFRALYGAMEKEAKAKAAAQFGRMQVKDAILLFEHRVRTGVRLSRKPQGTRGKTVTASTIKFRFEILTALKKSWPDFEEVDVAKIGEQDCQKWADRYAEEISASRFNSSVDTLWHIFNEAVKARAIASNPAESIGRASVAHKAPSMPTVGQFRAFVQEVRTGKGRFSKPCADFIEFMAFTGTRKNEAAHVEWRDVDFDRRRVHVRITKNGEPRWVPMVDAAYKLLRRMRDERSAESSGQSVVRVREAQKSMTRAAKKVGMDRITHHALRHLFATVAIEGGVDIPTVSRWLGHKDGGALAMKTYGHLRDDHSQRAALKVQF